MYLLDTCVISDFIKKDPFTMAKVKSLLPAQLFLSSISYMEIMYGLHRNPEKAKRLQPMIEAFLNAIEVLDFTQEDAKQAASIREYLSKQGKPIGPYDVLIAGIAVNHKLILVTSNLSEFKRVAGLSCENWRSPQTVS